jgi:endonuclease/exonuclease/phosphatase family metal-dependent hydrolase
MKLRIATWNIFLGLNLKSILKSIELYEEFKEIDIFALQEASVHNGVEDGRVIASKLGKQYKYYQVSAQTIRGFTQANAIIWNSKKIKINKKDTFSLPTFEELLVGRVERTIKRFFPAEHRNSVIVEGTVGDKLFRFYSVHFDVLGYAHKKNQLEKVLMNDKERDKVDFVCIAGDLNTFKILKRPMWTALSSLASEHGFVDITTTIKWTFSGRVLKLRQKTDAIFLKHKKTNKYSSWSSNIAGSDHIPLFAIIEI